MSLVAVSSGCLVRWLRRVLVRAGWRRRAISGALKRSFMRWREAWLKGVSPDLEKSKKSGKS